MKISFEIDATLQVVSVDYHENPTFQEIEKVFSEILAHPDYKTGFDFIVDRSRLREGPSAEYVEKLIKFLSANEEQVQGSHWAIIVSNALNHGMVRMVQLLAADKNITIKIFRSLEEGKVWLRPKGNANNTNPEKMSLP